MYVRADRSTEPTETRRDRRIRHGSGRYGTRRHRHQRNRTRCTAITRRCSTPGYPGYIDETISGLKFKIRFLRVNERHHTVAIASVNRLPLNPIRTRIQHCNVQVAELDDMTAAYQRVKQLGFQMALSVGQHTSDRELSFYAVTPSGFEWELGWNPIVDDESVWQPTTHQGISIWGHTPQGQAIVQLLDRFRTGTKSILRHEDQCGSSPARAFPTGDVSATRVVPHTTGIHPFRPASPSGRRRIAAAAGPCSTTHRFRRLSGSVTWMAAPRCAASSAAEEGNEFDADHRPAVSEYVETGRPASAGSGRAFPASLLGP